MTDNATDGSAKLGRAIVKSEAGVGGRENRMRFRCSRDKAAEKKRTQSRTTRGVSLWFL